VYELGAGFPFKIEGIDNDGEVIYYSEDFPQYNRCGKILKGARFFDEEGKELVIEGINEKTGRVEVTKKSREEAPEGGSTRKAGTGTAPITVEEDNVTRKMEKLLKTIDDLLRRLQS
jgi:hypothetical protein